MPEELLTYETIQDIKKRLIIDKTDLQYHARAVYKERYLGRNIDGSDETIEQRIASVAIDIASADMAYLKCKKSKKIEKVKKLASEIYEAMRNKEFLFGTPTMMNYGKFTKKKGNIVQESQMGSSCFVLPLPDKFGDENAGDGLLDQIKYQVLIHKSGGGTGFSFARIRPAGSLVKYKPERDGPNSIRWESPRGVASGPTSFLKNFYNPDSSS